jgi:hypothetical protein
MDSVGYYLRSRETWERTTSLGAALIGLEFRLTGRQERPSGRFMVDVSFAEWVMGLPDGWTIPTGESLAESCR